MSWRKKSNAAESGAIMTTTILLGPRR